MNEKISDMLQQPFGVVTSIDGLNAETRRAKYDTHKCGRCGADHKPEFTGWYVPRFDAYFDTMYCCPPCLAWYEAEYQRKQAILKSLSDLHAALNAKLEALPEIDNQVERDEQGMLHYESSYDGESITIQDLVVAFQKYEKQEPEILRVRKEKLAIDIERDKLHRLHEEVWAGSGFRPKANT